MQFIYTQNQAAREGEKVTFVRWLPTGKPSLYAMVRFQDGLLREVPARLLLPIAPNPAVR
jgi:hypothetical protein